MPGNDEFEDEESTAIFNANEVAAVSIPPAGVHRHVLVRMDGSDVGQVVNLPQGEYAIGRRPTADLVLNYDGVSRRHARIVFKNGNHVVEDLGSSNGTKVRGKRITEHVLTDGDIIQFGPRVSIRYSVTDSKEEKLLRHLYEASVRDSLTGGFNREYLMERLNTEIASSKRNRSSSALLLFDLDHFKAVNDTYGHQAGDAVLVAVAKGVMSTLRAEDVFARYGGEEFAVLLRGTGPASALEAAEGIRKLSHRVVHFEQQEIPVSVSVGISVMTAGEPGSAEELIAIADRRMYLAKNRGRNRVESDG